VTPVAHTLPAAGLDETDAALADAAERYLRERHAFDARRRLEAAQRRHDPATWRELAGLGWLAVTTPEALGGLGLRIGSVALLAQAAGRGLVNEPLASALVGADLLCRHGAAAQQAAWLAPLLAGDRCIAVAAAPGAGAGTPTVAWRDGRLSGRCTVVPDADIADGLLVQATDGGARRWCVLAADAPGLQRQPYPLVDGRGAATLVFDGCAAQPLQAGDDPHPLHLATLATVADALGAMAAGFQLTLDYLRTRRQFGVPLASFQVLQHRMVDQYVRLAEARAVLAEAVQALQRQPADAALALHAAKAHVGEQARLLLQDLVQASGGIGITDDYVLSHWLRRVRVDEQLAGSAEQHLQRFAALAEAAANVPADTRETA
jgi:alkylation response protein AidB-like acyl-CoA dehydrogenase